jgi:hypothetical protein
MAVSTLIRPTAKAELEPRRQVSLVEQLDALAVVVAQHLQAGAHGRMLDLGGRAHGLDMRPDDAMADAEEWRQEAGADVAVLVDGHRQHSAAVLAEPGRVIRAAAEKRHPVRRAGNCHQHLKIINLSDGLADLPSQRVRKRSPSVATRVRQ